MFRRGVGVDVNPARSLKMLLWPDRGSKFMHALGRGGSARSLLMLLLWPKRGSNGATGADVNLARSLKKLLWPECDSKLMRVEGRRGGVNPQVYA